MKISIDCAIKALKKAIDDADPDDLATLYEYAFAKVNNAFYDNGEGVITFDEDPEIEGNEHLAMTTSELAHQLKELGFDVTGFDEEDDYQEGCIHFGGNVNYFVEVCNDRFQIVEQITTGKKYKERDKVDDLVKDLRKLT